MNTSTAPQIFSSINILIPPHLFLITKHTQTIITRSLIQYIVSSQENIPTTFRGMDSTKSSGDAAINMPRESSSTKQKIAVAAVKAAATHHGRGGAVKRGVGIFDFILRICALAAALAATATMGTTDQTLPFFTQFFQFQASYDDLPAFTFFVIANAIASGYLVLSLPFSIVAIVRPHVTGVKLLLLILDTVLVAFTTAAASSAAAIVYLAHNGNSNTNWFAICQQFNDFCQRISGAVVASFIAAVIFIFLVVLSAVALRKH